MCSRTMDPAPGSDEFLNFRSLFEILEVEMSRIRSCLYLNQVYLLHLKGDHQ